MKNTAISVKSLDIKTITDTESEINTLKTLASMPFCFYLPQHYVGYVDNTSINKAIATIGLGPCIAIGVRNTNTGKISLAHVDDTTTLNSIFSIFDNMREHSSELLELYLVGGNMLSASYLKPIMNEICDIQNVEVILDQTFPENKGRMETQIFALDTEGNYWLDETEILFHYIDALKSPEIYNLYNATIGNYEYDLNSVSFLGDNPDKIVALENAFDINSFN